MRQFAKTKESANWSSSLFIPIFPSTISICSCEHTVYKKTVNQTVMIQRLDSNFSLKKMKKEEDSEDPTS
jgi:hypothetical protein